eukprot:TRINITY_DN9254_c0_g1_i4.p2 TRINITY_DN9254_c0_g1~~TRINITY_DN9254_c0_g1_i4.p2  ORF type:complete len:230 (-),score=60.98 TRINITY_DN9254_c0_g1_i4:14-703(-)
MDYKFTTQDGKTFSRIQYVKLQLTKTIEKQLKPFQKFNIIAFGSSLAMWQQEPVNATKENAASALSWINKQGMLGGTNIEKGLFAALQTKEHLEAIYLLSDGAPSDGIKDVNQMKSALKNRVQDRVKQNLPTVRVDAISFMLGGTETQQERVAAQNFLAGIAEATNGSFRLIDNKVKLLEQSEMEMEIEQIQEDLKHLRSRNTHNPQNCLLYTSPSPRDRQKSRMPSSA